MRTNLPVTGHECLLTDKHLIVSKTDLKGRITYINRDFIEISGFTEAELMGQPHNLVRHPDMPAEAFEDLWATLKQNRPWTGYVKNRCKNGDFYWVLANAAPLVEKGEVVGYISVRRRADPAVVQKIEAIYARFREKRQGRLKIVRGQAVAPSLLDGLFNLSVGGKLWAGLAAVIVVAGMAIASAWVGMQGTHARFEQYITHDQQGFDAYAEMYAQGLQMGQAIRNIMMDPANEKAYANRDKAYRDFQGQWEAARKALGESDALQQIATQSAEQQVVHAKIIALVKAGDAAAAQALLNQKETPLWRAYKQILLDQRQALRAQSVDGVEAVRTQVAMARNLTIAAGLLALVLALLVGRLLARGIRRPMQEMVTTFANIQQGNYSNVIDISRDDEIGLAMQGLQVLQTRMGFEVAEINRMAEEMARIKIALDGAAMPMTISDENNHLIYMNQAGKALFDAIAPVMQKRFPGFGADWLLGKKIGDYFEDEAIKSVYRTELTAPRTLDVAMGAHDLQVTATPVRDGHGVYLGRASQWRDRTQEIAVEREIETIINGAAEGDFTRSLATEGKDGFFLKLAQGLNQLTQTTAEGLGAVATVLNAVARGDLHQTMQGDYRGTFAALQNDVNATVDRLREVVGQIQTATHLINIAAREIAQGNGDLSSRTEEQASSLEETASTMAEINEAVRNNAENAEKASQLASSSNGVASRGEQMVRQVVETMTGIQQSSKRIADIVGVIDGIAFQTNILALNAAVEAARAGEQGRGFAVVASEVRNLAQNSATAAKEIKQLILESVAKVDTGAQLVNDTGATIDEMVTGFHRLTQLLIDITNASHEQSSGIDQVTRAVSAMDEITQQNAALVEEATAAAEHLEEQAQNLESTVSVFKLQSGRPTTQSMMPAARKSAGVIASKNVAQSLHGKGLSNRDAPQGDWEEF